MKFLSKEENVLVDFEQWVYDNNFLSQLGNNTYDFFVSFNFHSLYTEKDLEDFILNLYQEKHVDINKERVTWIVSRMVDGSHDLITGCAEISQLRSFEKGNEYIPILYVGYDSEIEDINYRYSNLAEEEQTKKKKLLELYKEEILKLSIKFLDTIIE
ncbi:hypothetical protein [Gorillibacterium massiliense]|uniref:hypothetical protein n=1 Tax=Gorillibacterium massiliense TaxID=1280390 RepID=UPI0012DBD606|nr:hypothetical protein [Gorillibacterium massiliense]